MSVIVLGPTNEYPEGKLGPDDDGELQLAIGVVDGSVRIEFGTPVAWLGMSPNQARAMAESLVCMAERVGGERG